MHNIHYWDFEEKCNRSFVLEDVEDYAKSNGDGYSGPLKWHDEVPPLKNRDAAEEWIKQHDKGWYDDHAVRYYDYSKAKDTKKIAELKARESDMVSKLNNYRLEHSVTRFKAEYIGCSSCGSRISRKHLRSDYCPVCRADLRSAGVIAKQKEYEDKLVGLRDKIKEETEKQTGNRTVRWLVKFEFHS